VTACTLGARGVLDEVLVITAEAKILSCLSSHFSSFSFNKCLRAVQQEVFIRKNDFYSGVFHRENVGQG
jgi:hypothetical protein